MKSLVAICLLAILTACGGGSVDDVIIQPCHPDTWDCFTQYANLPYVYEYTNSASELLIFSTDPALTVYSGLPINRLLGH